MLVVIIGGSASGKSQLAEAYCRSRGDARVYLATMKPYGADAYARIERHRRQRDGLGFETVECYNDLDTLQLPRWYDALLLECAGNLVANEMFDSDTPAEQVAEKVWRGIAALQKQVTDLVLVTNDIFGDGTCYQDGMAGYADALADVNYRAANSAGLMVEAVCGLPLAHKGEWIKDEERS